MNASAVILAAGLGTRLRPRTDVLPKCLVPIGGRAIIEQAVDSLESAGVRLVVPVVGYRAESVSAHLGTSRGAARLVYSANDDYAATGTAASLLRGLRTLQRERPADDVVVAEGDVWFDGLATARLLEAQAENVVAVDERGVGGDGSLLQLRDDRTVGSWHFLSHGGEPPTGAAWRLANLYRFSVRTWSEVLLPALDVLTRADARIPLEVALQHLCTQGRLTIHAVSLDGCRWWEVDSESDLAAARARCVHGLPPQAARLATHEPQARAD